MDRFSLAALDPADHAQELFALWQAAYTQEAELLGLRPAQFPPLQLGLRDLMNSSETWLGCWAGAELVGALAWGADEQDPSAQQISALIVAPAWQRQGVATRLLHALGVLAGRGPLTVHVAAANEPAQALLAAQGFRSLHRWLSPEGIRMQRWQRRPGSGT